MKTLYEALLRYYGENLNSTPSDVEFWAALSIFVDKFAAAQKAIVTVGGAAGAPGARRGHLQHACIGRGALGGTTLCLCGGTCMPPYVMHTVMCLNWHALMVLRPIGTLWQERREREEREARRRVREAAVQGQQRTADLRRQQTVMVRLCVYVPWMHMHVDMCLLAEPVLARGGRGGLQWRVAQAQPAGCGSLGRPALCSQCCVACCWLQQHGDSVVCLPRAAPTPR